jgi:uncharacterized protein YajQ (UPF0234 family)
MPSFDIVSELDQQEVLNAVDNANRELATRFDFRGVNAEFTLKDTLITMTAEAEFQLQQMLEIFLAKAIKRSLDVQGIETVMAKKLVKLIKDNKLKVQAAIQGEQVRVTGKKRDDLQEAMALIRSSELEQAFQFTNFRD